MASGWWLAAAAVVTALGTAALVAALWRHRDKPGAGWFLASLTCQALWGAVYGAALLTPQPDLRRALGILALALIVGMATYFVPFTLEYTGRGQLRGRPIGVVAALVPVALFGLAVTNHVHGLLWTPRPPVVEVAGLVGVEYGFRPVAQGLVAVGVLFVMFASLLLFDTVVSYGPLYRREAVAVGLSPVPPMTAFVVWLFGIGEASALNFAPVFFLAHVALDGYAFVGSDMFEFHPATRRRGERAAIDDLGSPVVIVDEQGRIITTNDAAAETLGVDKQTALTDPLSAHLEDDLDHREGGEVTVRVDGTDRTYSVTATPLAVDDDRVGSTLVWQDVTEARRREQRLAVLNRALRHNLRNDMTVVQGFTETAAERVEDPAVADMLETALGKTDALLSLGQTARDIEHTLEGEPQTQPVDLDAVVTEVVESAAPPGLVSLDAEHVVVHTDRQTLRTVLSALVENAVEHGTGGQPSADDARGTADGGHVADRPVRMRVEERPDAVAVVVADDGPGVPEGELAVVEAGEETALSHGSGLGLWLVRWGAERIGADLDFETGPDGTTVTVGLPRSGPAEGDRWREGDGDEGGTGDRGE